MSQVGISLKNTKDEVIILDYKCFREKYINIEDSMTEFIKQLMTFGALKFNKIYELMKQNSGLYENLKIVEMNFFYMVIQYEKDGNSMHYVIKNNKIEPNNSIEKLCLSIFPHNIFQKFELEQL